MAEMEVPGCPAGGIILFDMRLVHRGMPNDTERDRALAHTFLSTGFAFDQMEAPGSLQTLVEALPDDTNPKELRAYRVDVARQQREAWLAMRASSAR